MSEKPIAEYAPQYKKQIIDVISQVLKEQKVMLDSDDLGHIPEAVQGANWRVLA